METSHPFAQPNCENKSFELDHQISELMSHPEIPNSDHQFSSGALSKKREDDFSRIINQVLKIFWFQALRKPRFENKENF